MRAISIALAVFLSATASFAQSAARVALVIGNGGYEHVADLANPTNDANDLSTELRSIGFTVETLRDADYATLRRALHGFQRRAEEADVALIYFAGHGVEINKSNHMIPVDAKLERDTDVAFEAIPIEQFILAASEARQLSLVILDACRDNPFLANMQVDTNTRSIGRGLAVVEPSSSKNTLLAYAAKAGTVAYDGNDRNSPYARALIETIQEPGLEISLMFRTIRDKVLNATSGRQEPFLYGSLSAKEIYLNPPVDDDPVVELPEPVIPTPTPAPRAQAELTFWGTISNSQNPLDFEAYLQAFPDGVFVPLAQNRLASLEGPQTERSTGDAGAIAVREPEAPQPTEEPIVALDTDTRPSEDPLTRAEIRELQERLSILGFRLGLADGIAGPRTESAIRTYEEQNGAEPTGAAVWGVLKLLQNEVSDTRLVSWRAARRAPAVATPTPQPVETIAPVAPAPEAEPAAPVVVQNASERDTSQWCQKRYDRVCYHECSSATGFFRTFNCNRCASIHEICGKP